ncbi:MAG: FimB/Mfa2 family fimbrial subunit [Muribaculum sp.]|nr:FimB/Mfa2 family fimbrial subunit [Muribaculum sp.]
MKIRHLGNICISLLATAVLTGCITSDFTECPNEYELKLIFDRNMLFADAFASQVKSVDIKVFDSITGREVYSFSDEGDALGIDGYRVKLPIAPGSYNILCWAGMAEGNSFSYADPAADILEHQNVILNTENGISDNRLNNLYHGLVEGVTFIDNNTIGSYQVQTAVMSLTKDTNRIYVMLHNLDGTELQESDFTFSISSDNAGINYDNSLEAGKNVRYLPWHVSSILSETNVSPAAMQSSLGAEMSVGRLTVKSDSRLDVYRVADGERIISIPLERNLLLYKGAYHSYMSDQEYLDRQDDYVVTFLLDKNNNWDKAAMIYINNWATPPVQYQEW